MIHFSNKLSIQLNYFHYQVKTLLSVFDLNNYNALLLFYLCIFLYLTDLEEITIKYIYLITVWIGNDYHILSILGLEIVIHLTVTVLWSWVIPNLINANLIKEKQFEKKAI